MNVSQTTEFSVLLVNCMININECCFSFQRAQQSKVRNAYGAGQYSGLSVVLDTQQLEYFAALQPMIGIWVSHIQTVTPNSVK
jgi:hypothetical protein